jgi:hypothetical protein
VPTAAWPRVFGGALVLFVLFVGYLELRLALRNIHPAVIDSETRWLQERARAGALGSRALILVGASRMQLDLDLAVLRAETGLEPVQLAIDGTSFLPVLEGLAADPDVRGTVIVEVMDHLLTYRKESERSYRWQASYERSRQRLPVPDFESVEARLSQALRQRLRSYADGAQPLTSLRRRVLKSAAAQQYLVTLPDRSRLADFSKVAMPAFYFTLVMGNLHEDVPIPPGSTLAGLEQDLQRRIAALTPLHEMSDIYMRTSRELAAHAAAIRARGGRVIFVMLPKSGMVRDIDARRYPREQFWDRFAASVGTDVLTYEDVPAWKDLHCPDGSHLDFRQRGAFTSSLADVLGLTRGGG